MAKNDQSFDEDAWRRLIVESLAGVARSLRLIEDEFNDLRDRVRLLELGQEIPALDAEIKRAEEAMRNGGPVK